ncbi:MAG: Mrp/NBP35 family ATP-binding protein [Spirochaeta sp.]|jgi:ATP-binding protein involved in chromosome partitioning|nr:Mrp/NBP35 family ATP-binding protein [Spirochaeta sp.]
MIKGRENPQDTKLQENMDRVRYKIAVMSGKGGVGKSTVSTNLAWALAMQDLQVGLLDADIHGPNLPTMLGITEERFTGTDHEIEPIEVLSTLRVASVANIGYERDAALIWRGPMKLALIKQFLADVVWGDLDYLVLDTPPGTGDEALTIGQEIKPMTGIVIVTTPQDVALLDSRKSVDFASKLKIPVIGIIENMADSDEFKMFGSGGGERAAEELGVPFLGRVALDPRMVTSGDTGRPFLADYPDEVAGTQLRGIVDRIITYCKGVNG